jgi:DNA-binding transcriptional MerR regulator
MRGVVCGVVVDPFGALVVACRSNADRGITRRELDRVVPSHRKTDSESPEAHVNSTDASATPTESSGVEAAEAQGLLFDGDFSPLPIDLGFRGPVACSAAGITYRQLDYWARTGLVVPEVRSASGSGSQRLYSFRDILILKVIKRLIDAGISLQQIRTAIEHLRARGVQDLTQVTLMSDGVSVFECTSDDEVIDLLRGGQGVFGIALGGVWRDIEGTLAELPAERAEADEPRQSHDELSQRRQARATS